MLKSIPLSVRSCTILVYLLLSNFSVYAQESNAGCIDSLMLQNIQLPEGYFIQYGTKKTLNSGNILLAAYGNTSNKTNNFVLIECDRDGKYIQSFEHAPLQGEGELQIQHITEDYNNNILLGGIILNEGRLTSSFLLKLTSKFKVIWLKKVKNSNSTNDKFSITGLYIDDNDNVYITGQGGEADEKNLFLSLSANGIIQWDGSFPADNHYMFGAEWYSPNHVLVAGDYVYFFLPDYTGYLPFENPVGHKEAPGLIAYAFNKNTGQPIWQRKIGIPYDSDNEITWSTESGLISSIIARRPLDYFTDMGDGRLSIGFKAFYTSSSNTETRNQVYCHINAIVDTGLTASTARLIRIPYSVPLNTGIFVADWKVELNKHYQFCFSNRELNHKNRLFAVIDSNNNTLISKDIGNIFSDKAGIRGTEFLQSGNGISVMVTDGTADTRLVQNITVPYSLDSAGWKQSCAGKEDSTFFTVSPINLITQNFDAGPYFTNIIATEDLNVSQTPFTASSATVCKTISTCSTFSISGDTTACMGNTAWIKATKNNGCYKKIDWHFDSTAIQIGAITDSSIQVKFIKPGYTKVSASLYGCVLADSLVIKVAAPALGFSLGKDVISCSNNDSAQLVFSDSLTNVRWSTGDTTHAIMLRSAGKYWATVKDGCGNV
jgi:hypothetical protein